MLTFLSLPERAGTPPQFTVRHRARRVIESGVAVLHTRLGARSAEWRRPHTILAILCSLIKFFLIKSRKSRKANRRLFHQSFTNSRRRLINYYVNALAWHPVPVPGTRTHSFISLVPSPFEQTGNTIIIIIRITLKFGSELSRCRIMIMCDANNYYNYSFM